MSIAALTRLDDLVIAGPMTLSQPFRDDDIQRFPDGKAFRIAENALRSGIPKDNCPFFIRSDNGIGACGKNGFRECI